ncbi:beta-1,3-galactosyltransferase 1-like [Asterias amurensis]|uniref:beta-1,3-galactosyltransferase 1-like n=1 Tax=Asterias amurensis TaxID=7602 RepID=UPI003AB37EB0
MYTLIRKKLKFLIASCGIFSIVVWLFDKELMVETNDGSVYSDDVINAHDFHFTIANYDKCWNGTDATMTPFLLILVKTGPQNFYDRQQIRQTWGGTKLVLNELVSTVFLLGMSSDMELNQRITKESQEYEDIVQENFIDSYHNLTIKIMMGLKWVATFCPNVSYVASADADMMLNTVNLVNRLLSKPRKRYAEGTLRRNVVPVRDPNAHNGKWYTSFELYLYPTYAPFFPGSCYVMSGDLAWWIFLESRKVRYLPWDDVFFGLVLHRLGVDPAHGAGYSLYVKLSRNLTITSVLMKGIGVLVPHRENSTDERLLQLWNQTMALSERRIINSTNRDVSLVLCGIILFSILLIIFILGFCYILVSFSF